MADTPRPLDGMRILDFTHVLAGPFGTRILADMGADVVKVITEARASNAPDNQYYVNWNRNKRALSLDMSHDEGREVGLRLAAKADVVIDNFSPGVLDRWGIGYETVSPDNPSIIYVQMSGVGAEGPWADFVTFAPTLHALAGITALTGVPGRRDIGMGFSYNDSLSGLHAAVAVLAAVEERSRSGRGRRLDIAQLEIALNVVGPALLDYSVNGRVAQPSGNRLPYDDAAPHNCYPCIAEGEGTHNERWVAIACMTDEHWQSFRRVMGNPGWARDERYHSASGRTAHLQTLDEHVADWTRELTAERVMALCQAAGVPAGVVQSGVDLVDHDPQIAHDKFLFEFDDPHPAVGVTYGDRLPLSFSRTPADQYTRSRTYGEDNVAVLGEWLGLPEDEVRAGEDAGTFR